MSPTTISSTFSRFAGLILLCAVSLGASAFQNDPPPPEDDDAPATCERGKSSPGQCLVNEVPWVFSKSICPPSIPQTEPFYDCLPPAVSPNVFIQCESYTGFGYCSATPKAGSGPLTFVWTAEYPAAVYEHVEDPSWADVECLRNRGTGTVTVTVKQGSTVLGSASYAVSCRLTL